MGEEPPRLVLVVPQDSYVRATAINLRKAADQAGRDLDEFERAGWRALDPRGLVWSLLDREERRLLAAWSTADESASAWEALQKALEKAPG